MDPITILTALGLLVALGAAFGSLYPYIQRYLGKSGGIQSPPIPNAPSGTPDVRRLVFIISGTLTVVLLVVLISRIYQYHQDTTLPDAAYSALKYDISQDAQATFAFNLSTYAQYGPIGSWSVISAQDAPQSYNAAQYNGPSGITQLWCAIISPPLQWVASGSNLTVGTSNPNLNYLPISHFWIFEAGNQWQVNEVDQMNNNSSGAAQQAFQGVGCSY